mmetsp:Transcript_21926/g.48179  ORF Transcript_21926/g.48179 Transcript_21926/m.48179 type:complete len:232 (+) Transcript_21926:254-949(+)
MPRHSSASPDDTFELFIIDFTASITIVFSKIFLISVHIHQTQVILGTEFPESPLFRRKGHIRIKPNRRKPRHKLGKGNGAILVFVCNRKGMAKQIRWQIFQFFHARAVEKALSKLFQVQVLLQGVHLLQEQVCCLKTCVHWDMVGTCYPCHLRRLSGVSDRLGSLLSLVQSWPLWLLRILSLGTCHLWKHGFFFLFRSYSSWSCDRSVLLTLLALVALHVESAHGFLESCR